MSKFVLIHGAWHGKWVWEKLSKQLESRGHEVHSLDLPGHGLRADIRSKVKFNNYVDSIVSFINEKKLKNICLVGHSMGGIVIPKVAERIPNAISRVVYLAAFVLEDNTSLADNCPQEVNEAFEKIASSRKDGCIVLPEDTARRMFCNDTTEEDSQFILRNLTPQPLSPFVEKIPMKNYYHMSVPKSYLLCTRDQALPVHIWRGMSHRIKCDFEEFDAGHDCMVSQPLALSEILERHSEY